MSLKTKFKTNADLAKGGVWFKLDPNSDGTVPEVLLRRSGRANPLWGVAFRENSKDRDVETLTPEEDTLVMATTFAQACVADWKHMQPDDDGKVVKFSTDAAVKLLTDPDWIDLLTDWQAKAGENSSYQKEREGDAKN